jgi:putative serine/threonine protein kinase
MQSERASVDELIRTPYIQVLTYPKISLRVANSRVKQLNELGVEEIIFEGHAKIGRLGILGLGTVGIVVKAKAKEDLRALKIRRTDANRPNMNSEVAISKLVNRVQVGPDIFAHTRDMILMKLLDAQELGVWLGSLSGKGRRDHAREVFHALLNQCRKLDIMGIDHGQLNNLRKHAVIAEGKPWLIDFESASTERKTKNVTTAAQYLFIGGYLSPAIRRMLGIREVETLKRLLTDYKSNLSDYSYSRLLEHLKLVTA